MTPLARLADIASGYHVGTKIEDEPGGRTPLLQLRDLEPQHVRADGVSRVSDAEPQKHHHVRLGDVLFGARGVTRPAALVDETVPDGAVATSQLFMLRVTDERLDPAFLAWYLNTEAAEAFFDAFERGAVVRFIPKSVLAELPVPLPPLDRQRALAEAGRLARREARLSRSAAERRLELTEALLLRRALASDSS